MKSTSEMLLAERLYELHYVRKLAYMILKDEKDVGIWMYSPNSMMFGDTPFEVCARGDGRIVIAYLRERIEQP